MNSISRRKFLKISGATITSGSARALNDVVRTVVKPAGTDAFFNLNDAEDYLFLKKKYGSINANQQT